MTKEDIKLLASAGYITDVTLFDDSVKLDEVLANPSFLSKYVTQMGLTEEKINEILSNLKGDEVEPEKEPAQEPEVEPEVEPVQEPEVEPVKTTRSTKTTATTKE